MISVILYGRNDSYGYNLHKRAALSLNCIAEMLDSPDDEILFVDYNTPDDFPTFPEAIQDTLTPRAKRLLRVLRVRPRHHARFLGRSHLVALEPVARNVALRRSNPANRWILSTNTDMIFVPRTGRSLSAAVAPLADNYYHLPRFELPESLWESLDRLDPAGIIARIGAWGQAWHLNEIVMMEYPAIKYDGPGDFQLMLRDELFDMHGFDERMLLGWHVDSNIAMRLAIRHPVIGDLVDDLFGYHCDHTRQVTPAHRPGAVQNDLATFVFNVTESLAPGQPDWGMADAAIEEVRLTPGDSAYVRALTAAIPVPQPDPAYAVYGKSTFNRTDYDPAHAAPFLIDALCSYPSDTMLGWFGSRADLLALTATAWTVLGFSVPIAVSDPDGHLGATLPAGAATAARERVLREADVLVFDFGRSDALRADPSASPLQDPACQAVVRAFRLAYIAERVRLAQGLTPRRFIAVNALNGEVEQLVTRVVAAAVAPFSTRLRQGFVMPSPHLPEAGIDLMPRLHLNPSGRRDADGIVMAGDAAVFYGPYMELEVGTYDLSVAFTPDAGSTGRLVFEAVSGDHLFAVRVIAVTKPVSASLVFTVDADVVAERGPLAMEFRAYSHHGLRGRFNAVGLRRNLPTPSEPDTLDLWPLLTRGPAARPGAPRFALAVRAEGNVFHGPYIELTPGRYRLSVSLRKPINWRFWRGPQQDALVLEAVCDGQVVARQGYPAPPTDPGPMALDFEVPRHLDPKTSPVCEFRLEKAAGADGMVDAVLLVRLADSAEPPRHGS